MIIALTGTPGTGKTTIASQLRKQKIDVIDFQDFALKQQCDYGFDEHCESIIIDVEQVNQKIKEIINDQKITIIEGHLSHLLDIVDHIIILRCNPQLLLNRLQHKGWKKEKIKENIEAEILDIILCESIESHEMDHIYEIDTTNQTKTRITSTIIQLITNNFTEDINLKPGQIDWTKYLLDTSWMEN